ncbi:MAG: hypothetical protein HY033_12920 [Ignavibacteriae bacterium]|nr:hypothetical protein [Ignavibacteria bacterium]MBI3365795.1 hypothetical protein [Ignavibacteriota bacterium]
MQTEPENQYGYFLELERMVKVALAVYVGVLVTGLLGIAVGLNDIIEEIKAGNVRLLVFAIFGTGGIFLGTFALVGKVRWVSKLNVWLDQKFFNILDRSNSILLNAIFESTSSDMQQSRLLLDSQNKRSLAQHIFRRLASEDQLFGLLLDSNIFRLWIWYWILLYGSFTFTLLTISLFTSVAFGITFSAKAIFAWLWILALVHIGLGFFLGHYLIRVTRSTATAIVHSSTNEITALMKESLDELARSPSV